MASKQNSEFIVTRHLYTFKLCQACEGSGKKKRTFRKMNFIEDCSACKGEGRIKMTTKEEVPLVIALKELSIIK